MANDDNTGASVESAVLIALTELKVLVSELTKRVDASVTRSENHSTRLSQLERSDAVRESKIENLERELKALKEARDADAQASVDEQKGKRVTFPAIAASAAAVAATLAFVMQLGSKIGF